MARACSRWVVVQALTSAARLRRQRCCGASVPDQRALDQRAQSHSSPARRVTGGVSSARHDRREDEDDLQHNTDRRGGPTGGSTSPPRHHFGLRTRGKGFEPQIFGKANELAWRGTAR